MTACHKAKETDTEKIQPNPRMMQSVAEHQKVPKEEAAVMPVRGLRKRRGDRNLAVGHHQKPKGRIEASCESRKRLTVAGRRMICCAGVAWFRRMLSGRTGPGTRRNKEPRNDERTGRDCGKARNATLA
jgi:hypothetical protein